jgi:hypothetical protein
MHHLTQQMEAKLHIIFHMKNLIRLAGRRNGLGLPLVSYVSNYILVINLSIWQVVLSNESTAASCENTNCGFRIWSSRLDVQMKII